MSEKHKRIARVIAQRISSGTLSPGDRLPTQQELCAEFNVSRSYIHEVFNILDSKGLIDRRAGRGVFVASASPSVKLRCVGVVSSQGLDSGFSSGGLFYEVITELQRRNCRFHVMKTHDFSEKNIIPWARSNEIDGLMFIRPARDKIVRLGMPAVVLENYSLDPNISYVDVDYFNGIFSLMCRIHAAGYRKVDFVFSNGSKHDPFIRGAAARCLNELPDMKLRLHDVIKGRPFTPDDHNEIYALTQRLIDRNDLPEILLGQHDWTCIRMLETMRQNKIQVPGKVCVASLFGIVGLKSEPKLSSLTVDESVFASRAVSMLSSLFSCGMKSPCFDTVPMKYVEKDSMKLGVVK